MPKGFNSNDTFSFHNIGMEGWGFGFKTTTYKEKKKKKKKRREGERGGGGGGWIAYKLVINRDS